MTDIRRDGISEMTDITENSVLMYLIEPGPSLDLSCPFTCHDHFTRNVVYLLKSKIRRTELYGFDRMSVAQIRGGGD